MNSQAIKALTFAILCSLSTLVFAQSSNYYRQAIQALNTGDLNLAVTKFQEAIKLNTQNQDAWYYLGMTLMRLEQYQQAAFSFKKLEAVNPNYKSWFYFETAKALIELGKFSAAETYLQKFEAKRSKGPKHTTTKHLIKNRLLYSQISPLIRDLPVTMKEPLPIDAINSLSNDYMPQVNPMGNRLYFTSVRKGGFNRMDDSTNTNNWGEDVYFSTLENESWSDPVALPAPINSIGNDFGSAFTADGQTMVFVRCGDENSVGNCDLYITQLNGTEWSEPQNMGNVVNSEAWDSQPTISSDGNRIIFASSREGGYGGMDLYLIEKNYLGFWGIPQNLGSTVNTPLNDNSPYLAADGKTLYYATGGHPGYGGMDIFYTLLESGKWSKPANVGRPLNSSGDDTNFTISALGIAYFASSRLDESNYDIFEVELPDHLKPKPTAVVQGVVSSAKDGQPLDAWVVVEDINSSELLAINKSNATTGEYTVVLPAGRHYSVSANSDGFFFYSQSFELPKDTSYQEITKDIALEPIEKGAKVVLNNIFFEVGRAELKPISYVELNKAVELLENNGSMVIEVGGHTDSQGSDEQNLKLSQARANSVKDYLVLAGIVDTRIRAKGYGESQPIADNTTSEGRASNRRTEFVIIEF
ncbi:MAG: PD40 domain-containing protein [Cyclobacteriaceae bacterium]|nr:PD40 domain-containing protein [Cyclobacteriaceae bacterium HetDA_MAG_MS6]